MKKGDVVKFKEIVDPGDENDIMILMEDPDGGRVRVQHQVENMTLKQQSVYDVSALVKA